MSSPGSLLNFTVSTNEAPISSSIQVVEVETWASFGTRSRARIVVFDGSPAEETFPISSSQTFAPGARIAIAAGYDRKTQPIFDGTILAQQIEIGLQTGSRLVVEAVATDQIARPGAMPPPVLSLTFGDNILDLKSTTDGPAKSSGKVRFAGSALAMPGAAMTLAGLGDRFSGTALIAGVHHVIQDGQWTTAATYEIG